MIFFPKIFGSRSKTASSISDEDGLEQALIIKITLTGDGFGTTEERAALYELEDEIMTHALSGIASAQMDGHEFGAGECTLFIYGKDADELFAAVHPLIQMRLQLNGTITKRFGPPGSATHVEPLR